LCAASALAAQHVIDAITDRLVAAQDGAACDRGGIVLKPCERALKVGDLRDHPAQAVIDDLVVDGDREQRVLVARLVDEEQDAAARQRAGALPKERRIGDYRRT
jgi:hypothetical protein